MLNFILPVEAFVLNLDMKNENHWLETNYPEKCLITLHECFCDNVCCSIVMMTLEINLYMLQA